MKYLLIVLVLGLALAPLVQFMPSKRMRRLAAMREYAAVNGLFVEFRDLPGSSRPGPAPVARNVIYYGRRLPPSRRKPRLRRAWLRSDDGWRGVGHREPVPTCSGEMPPPVLALGVDEGSCGAYWEEVGGEAEVEAIVAALKAWEEALVSG